MKRLDELTLEDLERSRVWRYEGGSDADALVEPSDLASLAEEDSGVFIVRTSFELADGSVHWGYCSPADDSGLDYVQPVIVTANGHAPLFFETAPSPPEPETTCGKLDRSLTEVFPLHFRAEVPVDGLFAEGVVSEVHAPK